jgi:hypothetical protein
MNYPNYDSKVVDRYQTKLVGWTYQEFKSPFDIHTIDVRILLEALKCGRCCWVRMTKSDMNNHRDEVNNRREAGETVGKARQPRSDKGLKRPRKKAPGAGEGTGDDGGEMPPAKKQKKAGTAPKPRTTTTKAPKNTKKKISQLPPTRPSSKEFIDDDTDDAT